ncbi:MAG: hypothetical protein AAF264_10925, partial [Pseudomonadota bacterium]
MYAAPSLLLKGRVVHPDGSARERYLLIRDGAIRWISRSRPPAGLLEGVREITTGPEDWIFPGLIDLHSHTGFNFLPLWSSDRAPFDNRHVWRRDGGYRAAIRDVRNQLRSERKARKIFAELQAVAGGTTLLDEPYPLDSEDTDGATVLCRSTGNGRDLGLPDDNRLISVVDFFRPDREGRPRPAPGWNERPSPLEAYQQDRGERQAYLVHIAEGRSGFGTDRSVDSYSRAEFEELMAHPSMADVGAVRASNLVLVHASGVNTDDPAHLK